ncbi:MAG: c-type cytochrome [Ferruginibacter sp.]
MQVYLLIPFFILVPFLSQAQQTSATARLEKGKLLAKPCMECHASPGAALADPLRGIRKSRTADYIYSLIKNPMVFADENKTAKKAFAKRGLQMPPFPDLTKADIKAILDYFDSLPTEKK